MAMKEKGFQSIQDIEAARTVHIRTFKKENLKKCCRKWPECWDSYVKAKKGQVSERGSWQCVFYSNTFSKKILQQSPYFDHSRYPLGCVIILTLGEETESWTSAWPGAEPAAQLSPLVPRMGPELGRSEQALAQSGGSSRLRLCSLEKM